MVWSETCLIWLNLSQLILCEKEYLGKNPKMDKRGKNSNGFFQIEIKFVFLLKVDFTINDVITNYSF